MGIPKNYIAKITLCDETPIGVVASFIETINTNLEGLRLEFAAQDGQANIILKEAGL